MTDDPRCCGSGTCIIDPEGRCWCGQQWNGQAMCHAPLAQADDAGGSPIVDDAAAARSPSRAGSP